MLIFAGLLIAAAVIAGFYVFDNGGSHDVSLMGWHWSGAWDWVPVIVAAGAVGLILFLCMVYSSTRISGLKRTNLRLTTEVQALRRALSAMPSATRPATPAAEHEVVGRSSGPFGWFGGRRKAATDAEYAGRQRPVPPMTAHRPATQWQAPGRDRIPTPTPTPETAAAEASR